ncbi:MAG: hypothetical protein AAF611_00305 [Bacteroidota bacterium]
MKNIHIYIIVLLSCFCFSCGNSGGKEDDKISIKAKAEKELAAEKKRIKANKTLFIKSYDTIARKSIELVFGRHFNNEGEEEPDISTSVLNKFNTKIDGTRDADSLIRSYVSKFIKGRDNLLKDSIFISNKNTFKTKLKAIPEWDLIKKSIIYGTNPTKNEEDKKTKGEALLKSINVIITNAVSKFKSKGASTDQSDTSTSNGLGTKELIFFGILALSLFLNFFLAQKLLKKKPDSETTTQGQQQPEERSTYQKNLDDFEEKVKEKEKKPLTKNEVQIIVDKVHKDMIHNLGKYSKECINTVENLHTIKDNLIEIILKNKHTDINKVKDYTRSQLSVFEKNIANELKNCNNRKTATQKIEKALGQKRQQNFGLTKLSMVSEAEIDAKVALRTQNLIDELPITIFTEELDDKIERVTASLIADFEKLIDNALIYYLPFADANGYFKDSKKSKTKKVDSAVKIQIDPDDPTKASYSFLYEEKTTLKNAILSYDTLLIPVAILKSQNFNRRGTIVEQIGADGTLRLVDNLWEVEQKLEIKIS